MMRARSSEIPSETNGWALNIAAARITGLFRKWREQGVLASFHFFACLAEDCETRRLKFRRMLGHN